jgi:Lambda phage tail tube protein, TTP
MTATRAIIGYGSLFQTSNNDSPLTWSSLSEVRSMTVPPISRSVIDAGHECAPDEWREVLTGLNELGELTVEANFYKTVYQDLLAEFGTRVIKTRRIVFPGGSNLVFDAYLISIESALAKGDIVLAQVKFRPSGDATFTVV